MKDSDNKFLKKEFTELVDMIEEMLWKEVSDDLRKKELGDIRHFLSMWNSFAYNSYGFTWVWSWHKVRKKWGEIIAKFRNKAEKCWNMNTIDNAISGVEVYYLID